MILLSSMDALEAISLRPYVDASQLWTLTRLRDLFSGIRPGISYTQFTKTPVIFYLRRELGNEDTIVNVFDSQGDRVYSIERLSALSTLWVIYNASDRSQVAKLHAGLFTRDVFFIGKPEIHYRRIGRPRLLYGGLPDRKFYLTDGVPHEWTYHSKFLERIVNPGGGQEETRQRLASVQLLRNGKFDWELALDSSIDQEVALATAFISMLTQWSINGTPGVRRSPTTPQSVTTH